LCMFLVAAEVEIATARSQLLELRYIEFFVGQPQPIAAGVERQPRTVRIRFVIARLEHAPDMRDVNSQRARRSRRRGAVPQLVDESCNRNRDVRPRREQRKESTGAIALKG